jgi:glycosyltransferase involved in cell wall biosynthesis
VEVAYLCADGRYRRAGAVARKPAEPLPDGPFVVYPANRWPHKNHDLLLRALRHLNAELGIAVHAVFTGYDAPGGYPVAERAREYGVAQQVHSVGYVTVEEMAFLYTRASVLAFPSLFEGFGIPLAEAMAAGCPIVAARATSIPEVAGDAAEYFDPHSPESLANAIALVMGNDAHRQALIDRGRSRSRLFSPDAMASCHLKAFEAAAHSFSKTRYAWNRMVYQPYHRIRTHWKHRKTLLEARMGAPQLPRTHRPGEHSAGGALS